MELSIIIACYAAKPVFFRQTLDSFLNSGCLPEETEFVICDDASPVGGEGDLAREYALRYPGRFKIIRNESHCEISLSYQKLVEAACGRYIMPFDCDDIFVPFDVKGSIDFLDHNTRYAATYGRKRLFNREGDMMETHGGDYSLLAISIDPRMTHNGMLIRRSDLLLTGGYCPGIFKRPHYGLPDVVMWIGLAAAGKEFFYDGSIRAYYRRHDRQYSMEHYDKYAGNYADLRKDLLETYEDLANKLLSNQQFGITPEEINVTVIIIGALLCAVKLPIALFYRLTEVAEKLRPDDYAVYEYRIRGFEESNDRTNALAQDFLMYLNFKHLMYIRQLAFQKAAEFCQKDNLPNCQYFTNERAKDLDVIFSLSESQSKLMEQCVKNWPAE